MKKLLCVILSLTLLIGCIATASAAGVDSGTQTEDITPAPPDYPFVLVRGMEFTGLYFDYGTENQRPAVKEINALGITKMLGNALTGALRARSIDGVLPAVIDFVDDMLGSLACDNEGNSVYDLSNGRYPLSLANYPDFVEPILENGGGSEIGILQAAIERYGAEYVYYFNYDWRLDPTDTADDLDALIAQAKADHNTDKVNVVACSMGGVIMNSYIYEYGNENINKCVFLSSTFQGAYVTTDLFQGKVNVSEEALYYFLKGMSDSFFIDILYKTGLIGAASKFANSFIAKHQDFVFDSFLREKLGTISTYWAIVQPDEFDACVEYMFATDELKEEYSVFIERVTKINEMMSASKDYLLALPENGTAVAVIASYNNPIIPVYASANTHGDGTLESAMMLGGAIVADMGKTLGDDYVAANPEKLSPDRFLDLSEVLFPDFTWALKDAPHVGCNHGTDTSDFLFWIVDFDGQPTVNSNPKYPQFMKSSQDGTLELF